MADRVRIPSKPYMVSTEQWKNAAIALEVAVVKLEAELHDAKRALEIMDDGIGWTSEECLEMAKRERLEL